MALKILRNFDVQSFEDGREGRLDGKVVGSPKLFCTDTGALFVLLRRSIQTVPREAIPLEEVGSHE